MTDVSTNRSHRNWTLKEQIGRVLWSMISPAFRYSPRLLWSWRSQMLRFFGATVGTEVHIYPTVRIALPWNLSLGDQCAIGDRAVLYALGPITIGKRTTVSQGVHLCAGSHDWQDPTMPLLKLPISIGDDAWVCADAFIGPNVDVGRNAIVGARAVVMRDVDEATIVAGNPAKTIKKIDRIT